MHLWLPFHSFTHYPLRGCLQGSWHCQILTGLTGFTLKSGLKPPWPQNYCILHACKTSITWITSSSAAPSSNSQPPLGHDWAASTWLKAEKHFPRWPCVSRLPQSSLLKTIFKISLKPSHPSACVWWGPANYWDDLKVSFLVAWCKVLSLFLVALISNFPWTNFTSTSLPHKMQFFKPFSSAFCSQSPQQTWLKAVSKTYATAWILSCLENFSTKLIPSPLNLTSHSLRT
jgi:hypothetical protein